MLNTESAKRIMLLELEVTLLMGAESSWQVVKKAQLLHSLVRLVVAIGTSTEGKWKQRWHVIVLHLLQMVIRISMGGVLSFSL